MSVGSVTVLRETIRKSGKVALAMALAAWERASEGAIGSGIRARVISTDPGETIARRLEGDIDSKATHILQRFAPAEDDVVLQRVQQRLLGVLATAIGPYGPRVLG